MAVAVSGCEDQEAKKRELLAKTGVLDAAAASATPEPKAAESQAPVAAKPPKVCPEGKDVVIDDADIEEDVRKRLAKPKDKVPTLTTADLARVESLNIAKKASLDELDPCIFSKLTGLRHLYLGKGQLKDLSPISGLTQLESLIAPANAVEDLKPIMKLVKLDRIDLSKTRVKDLSPLASLVNVTELQIDDTPVGDISALASMKKLQKVSMRNTYVKDVSPLKDLKDLRMLTVKGTPIENLDTLAPLKARGLKIITN